MEQGEKNSSHFCNFEKRHQERNIAFLVNQEDCHDNNIIANEVSISLKFI